MRRDCWECGPTVSLPSPARVSLMNIPVLIGLYLYQCLSCMIEVLRSCVACGGEYCIDHNDGCSPTKVIKPMIMTAVKSIERERATWY